MKEVKRLHVIIPVTSVLYPISLNEIGFCVGSQIAEWLRSVRVGTG